MVTLYRVGRQKHHALFGGQFGGDHGHKPAGIYRNGPHFIGNVY